MQNIGRLEIMTHLSLIDYELIIATYSMVTMKKDIFSSQLERFSYLNNMLN